MLRHLSPAFRILLLFTILTGLVYPGVVTVLSQLLFPRQANGSLISINGRVAGSDLIGQSFTRPEYFHPRPSAAGGDGYDAAASTGSNFGATNQKLADRVKASTKQFRRENPDYQGPLPADIVTASGSGLDPEISPAAAEAQASRVAKARGVSVIRMRQLIATCTKDRIGGLLGEPRVNVLQLNLALDRQFARRN